MRTIIIAIACLLSVTIAQAETKVAGGLPVSGELERTEGLETEYGVIRTSDGLRLRSYVTRPDGSTGPLPAVFVTQWVSCGSMRFPENRDTQLRLVAQQSGLAMIRIDRAGSGDSEGAGCDQLDYDTEVRHYREALEQVKRHRWIDPERIVILGSSLGSTTAPLVAQGMNVAGVIVQGGGAVTYLERMIGFERIFVERSGSVAPADIHREMIKRIAFLNHYLTDKMAPEEIAEQYPHLANVWASIRGTGENDHYGRPLSWHQQAADRNFLAAWLSLDASVMVVFGEYEQFETRHGHRMIVDMINRQAPGRAEWLEISQADHGLALYPDALAAYAGEGGTRAYPLYVNPVSRWLRRVTALDE